MKFRVSGCEFRVQSRSVFNSKPETPNSKLKNSARVAQLTERWSYKPEVEGLSPFLGTTHGPTSKIQSPNVEKKGNADFRRWTQDIGLFQLSGRFSDSEDSTYLHLLVNTLEYRADKELLGELKARQVMDFWATDHHTWVYR